MASSVVALGADATDFAFYGESVAINDALLIQIDRPSAKYAARDNTLPNSDISGGTYVDQSTPPLVDITAFLEDSKDLVATTTITMPTTGPTWTLDMSGAVVDGNNQAIVDHICFRVFVTKRVFNTKKGVQKQRVAVMM
jgi:hypothetical protein